MLFVWHFILERRVQRRRGRGKLRGTALRVCMEACIRCLGKEEEGAVLEQWRRTRQSSDEMIAAACRISTGLASGGDDGRMKMCSESGGRNDARMGSRMGTERRGMQGALGRRRRRTVWFGRV